MTSAIKRSSEGALDATIRTRPPSRRLSSTSPAPRRFARSSSGHHRRQPYCGEHCAMARLDRHQYFIHMGHDGRFISPASGVPTVRALVRSSKTRRGRRPALGFTARTDRGVWAEHNMATCWFCRRWMRRGSSTTWRSIATTCCLAFGPRPPVFTPTRATPRRCGTGTGLHRRAPTPSVVGFAPDGCGVRCGGCRAVHGTHDFTHGTSARLQPGQDDSAVRH